ncbi:MAG: ATP-binding cassette domain-containing protein [Oscillospiraceae bacterium]|nr:ATP-binding cassette domain-containing protein [Oscillospiraceae bacterium]
MNDIAIKIENISKEYRLGVIGARTLKDELQAMSAKFRGNENPNSKIGTGCSEFKKGDFFKALDDVSFEVKKGDAVAIIGANGAGKSTLLKLISRITAPSAGKICINGKVSSMLEVGTGFHRELTGRENIYMNGAILGMSRSDINRRLDEIIEFSGISQFIDTPVKRYSSGMFVRLAFSVAAHLNSDILILDEILSVGDESFKQSSLGKMDEISKSQGKTILYVSHNMSTVRRLCSKAIVLDKGRLIFDGRASDGIEQYMSVCASDSCASSVELENNIRSKYLAQRAVMQKIEFEGKNAAKFSNDEKCIVALKWRALENIENAMVRIVIKTADRNPVGMSISDCAIHSRKDEQNTTRLALDISHLCQGKFFCDISISQKTSNGKIDNLDRVENAFSFEYSGSTQASGILWQSSAWGSNVFDKIEIL